MQALLSSASLLTVVVVAGLAAFGWFRGRPASPTDDDSDARKKHDDPERLEHGAPVDEDQLRPPQRLEVIVDPPQATADRGSRRQYVKAVCDRFEPAGTNNQRESGGALEELPTDAFAPRPPPLITTTSGTGSKGRPSNNLNSFVRQCVSNIERATTPPSRTPSPRRAASNQCDSPPKRPTSAGADPLRVPLLVAATDLSVSTSSKLLDDEIAVASRGRPPTPPPDNNRSAVESRRPLGRGIAGFTPSNAVATASPPPPTTTTTTSAPRTRPPTPELPCPIDDCKKPTSPGVDRLRQFQQRVPSNLARSASLVH